MGGHSFVFVGRRTVFCFLVCVRVLFCVLVLCLFVFFVLLAVEAFLELPCSGAEGVL